MKKLTNAEANSLFYRGGTIVKPVNDGRIYGVNHDIAKIIIVERKPLGKFYTNKDEVWIGIDNSKGDAWTEEFKLFSQCKKWLES